eukprot:1792563-Alexandrium_andersonii.AAC.1
MAASIRVRALRAVSWNASGLDANTTAEMQGAHEDVRVVHGTLLLLLLLSLSGNKDVPGRCCGVLSA